MRGSRKAASKIIIWRGAAKSGIYQQSIESSNSGINNWRGSSMANNLAASGEKAA